MARPPSQHVKEVKASLFARLKGDSAHPGARFLSTRAISQRFNISYQTAHRLLAEFEADGLLERRKGSGSYIPGKRRLSHGVQLIFHSRAQRKGSFGAQLLDLLAPALAARGIHYEITFPGSNFSPSPDHYPMLWECRDLLNTIAASGRFALCLNDQPPPGLAASYVDAVTTDDYSGGACAADILSRNHSPDRFIILAGPADDRRSQQRIAGFQARIPSAKAITAASWDYEAGLECGPKVLSARPTGVFACSDRLAQSLIDHCRANNQSAPPLVGFDNAPIAEQLRLSTIGIPWAEMVAQATAQAQSRINGSTTRARLISLAHEPILRLTT